MDYPSCAWLSVCLPSSVHHQPVSDGQPLFSALQTLPQSHGKDSCYVSVLSPAFLLLLFRNRPGERLITDRPSSVWASNRGYLRLLVRLWTPAEKLGNERR